LLDGGDLDIAGLAALTTPRFGGNVILHALTKSG